MHFKKIVLPFLFLTLLVSFDAIRGVAQPIQPNHPLKVGVAGSAPFVIDTKEQTGISLEIWQRMANLNNTAYHLIPFDDVGDALNSLDSGKLDVVIGPISITPQRIHHFWFTQPYFMTSLTIMAKGGDPTLWERIKPFFSPRFFYAIFIFLIILGIAGTLIWLAERNENSEEFPHPPASGIANGMWCAIVTMTTTGYGDRSPRTFWGRVITGTWMVVSIIFATTMVAGIASTLTLSGINTNSISKIEQLQGRKIAVIKDSPAESLVKKHNGKIVYVDDLDQAYQYLKSDKVVAIVYDKAQLLYLAKTHKDDGISVSNQEYARQGYGFAVKPRSTLLWSLNEDLLTIQESGSIDQIIENWIGQNEDP